LKVENIESTSPQDQTLTKSESIIDVTSSPEISPKLSIEESASFDETSLPSKKENQEESIEQTSTGPSSGSISPESPPKEESNSTLTVNPISTSESKEDVDSDLVAPPAENIEVESGEDTIQSSVMEIEPQSTENKLQMELAPNLQVTLPLNEKDDQSPSPMEESPTQKQSNQENSTEEPIVVSSPLDTQTDIQTVDTNLPEYLEGSPVISTIPTLRKKKAEQEIEAPSKTEEVDLSSTVKTTDCK